MARTVLFAITAFLLLFPVFAATPAIIHFPFALDNGITARLTVETTSAGNTFRQRAEGSESIWENNLYRIGITPRYERGVTYLRAYMESTSRKPLNVSTVSLRIAAPRSGIAGVWTPSGRVEGDRLPSADPVAPFVTYSAANYGIPYLAAATAAGDNAIAFGLLEQGLPVEIRATPATPELIELSLSATPATNEPALIHEFFISADKSYSWYGIAEAYADWVDAARHYSPFPISSRAYEPVYDTWYWSQDDVNDDLYVQTAEEASRLGLGTFLADSGWDAPAGEYSKWLTGRTGDYSPPPTQFTNLSETFDILRSQFHLQVQLWLQPFAVGRNSKRYPQTRSLHIQIVKPSNTAGFASTSLPLDGTNNLEDVNLCPRLSVTHQYLKDLFTEMSRTYHPEAYWLDFIDGMPAYCIARHQHDYPSFGEGLSGALGSIRDTILGMEQDPVIQFRAQYANLHNKTFANVWQPFDSPGDYERMRLDTLRLRPFSKGVVFASDQLYWPSDADDETVSRFVMADVMSGVPSIGANLLELRPSALEIVKNWMQFYRTYQTDLTTGRFRPFGSFRKPNHRIESTQRIFAYIVSNFRVLLNGWGKKEVFLMNASQVSRVNVTLSVFPKRTYKLQAFDRYLQPSGAPGSGASDSRGILDVNAVVEPGGFLMLTRDD
jgi:hypothetical protein